MFSIKNYLRSLNQGFTVSLEGEATFVYYYFYIRSFAHKTAWQSSLGIRITCTDLKKPLPGYSGQRTQSSLSYRQTLEF